MRKINLAIIFGGMSAEYKVSLHSAYAVITHLDLKKYNPIYIGITEKGEWLRFLGDVECIRNDNWHQDEGCTNAIISPCREMSGLIEFQEDQVKITPLDVVFPVMHGTYGEDGCIQGLLELAGIPMIGCGTLASAVCMDKNISNRIVKEAGISVPESKYFGKQISVDEIEHEVESLGYPLFIKPVRAGSSFGISKVESSDQLLDAVVLARRYDDEIIIEEAIEGFEVGCAVLGKDELIISEIDEVELLDGFFDYTEKYNLISSKLHVPARVSKERSNEVKAAATKIYKALDCKGFARVDLFIKPDGEIVYNEVNTIPGFTEHSRYPSMMQTIGIDFGTLVDMLIQTEVRL